MSLELAFAVFVKFYRLDPLDLTWGRFRSMYGLIGEVQEEFRPKTAIEIALKQREAQIKAWRKAHPEAA